MTKRFKNAYNALVRAYYNNTLVYSDCEACAVGNIIAEANNYKLFQYQTRLFGLKRFMWKDKNGNNIRYKWTNAIKIGEGKIMPDPDPSAIEELLSTGYSPEDLATVEYMFSYMTQKFPVFEIMFEILKYLGSLDNIDLESNPFKMESESVAKAALVY